MTLSKDSVLQSLLAECNTPARRKTSQRVRVPSAPHALIYQTPIATTRVCRCGTCWSCRENARWDRIFEAKFADPDYYKRRGGIQQGSPLGSL